MTARDLSANGDVELAKGNDVSHLREMFASIKDADLVSIFQDSGGDIDHAVDQLLNIQYLESVDGRLEKFGEYSQLKDGRRLRPKRRKRGKNQTNGSPSPDVIDKNRAIECCSLQYGEIAYISEKLDLPFEEAAAEYAEAGYSRAAAITTVIDRYVSQGVVALDHAGTELARRISRSHQGISIDQAAAIVQVTAGATPSWIEELAELIGRHRSSMGPQPLPQIVTSRIVTTSSPVVDESASAPRDGFIAVRSRSRKAPLSQSPSSASLTLTPKTANLSRVLQAASRESAATASNLRRRGGSNPLYRQAAAVYFERSSEQAQLSREAASAAAEELVASRETRLKIDLHGVSVDDGVRIAVARVRNWWNSERRATDDDFVVVTGRGRHSSGGASSLRRNVMAALGREGWDIRAETGYLVVLGRVP